jgi:hypothetical protein
MARALLTLALLLPTLAVAQPTAPAAPAASAPATPSATSIPTATASPTAATVAPPPIAAPVTPGAPAELAAARPPQEQPSAWLVLKGGWFGTSQDYQGDSFSGSGEWELAVGTGRVLGIELGGGSMTTSAGGLDVRTIPILLTLRLAIPIAMVSPHLDVGGGVYFNTATLRDQSFDATTAGWHAGVGCDVMLGRLVVGADLRYMGIAPTFSTIGKVTLDRYAALLKAGVRF